MADTVPKAASDAVHRRGPNIFDESKPMWQKLIVFVIPLMLSNIMQSASQTFSNIFVGRMLGVDALAAVSSVFPVIFLLFSFLIGIASGSTVLIGQAYGAGDEHRVKKVAGTVLGATLAFGIAVGIIGPLVSPWMLVALGTPANILTQADAYTKVVFLISPIIFPYIAYTTFLRGTGDSTTPFYFLIVSTVLSFALIPVLIRGWFGLPEIGILAPAIANLIADAAAFGALVWWLARTRSALRFDIEMARDMLVDWKILWAVMKIGIPTGIQVIMVSLAEIAVISFVNRFGSSATAAYGAVNQVVSYVQFPAISMSIAASIFGAQCIGAKREDLLGQVVRSAVGLSYAIVGSFVAICYAGAWFILGWFITDEHTLNIAHTLLMITLWSYMVFGNSAVLSGVMRSSGTVLVPTLNGIFSIWGVNVPVSYLLMHIYGLNGVWMGYPISFAVALGLQYSYYTFFWKKRTHQRLV